ncbi:3',5'-cyclic-nucleotide phosphodiesterase [Tulasnella sp. 424]|nr:3',5'-cyclic-nucleotide phosphodiesterase [Tulasnella sp. 424]
MAAPVPPMMPPSAKADSTPSAICFPAPVNDRLPAISPLDRALAHLRRAKRELEELAEDLSQIVLLADRLARFVAKRIIAISIPPVPAYTSNEQISGNVSAAAMEQGAKGILTPPFTPDAVLGTFATALNVKPSDISPATTLAMTRQDSLMGGPDGSLFASLAQYALPAPSQPQLAALRIPPSVIRATHTPVRSAVPPSAVGPSGSIYHHFKPLPPLPLITPRSSLSQPTATATAEIEVKVDVDTKVESASEPAPQPKPESPASSSMSASAQSADLNKVKTTDLSPKAEPPTPTPAPPPPVLTQPQPKFKHARLPSALPLAADLNQPLPSELKSLPPLSPPPVQKDSPRSPTSPQLTSKPALASSISMTGTVSAVAAPNEPSDPFFDFTFVGPRRKSVDTGGLALALKASSDDCLFGLGSRGWTISAFGPSAANAGWGWGGWDEVDAIEGPLFAELLSDMYVHTQNTTDEALVHFTSSFPLHSSTRRRLINQLSRWDFEPHNLTSDELLECAFIVFEALFRVEGMSEDSQIPVEGLETQFRPFISAVRSIYHSQNKYHNFQHAIDVLQAVYSFLVQAECVPPLTILLDGGEELEAEEGELRLPLPSSGSGSSRKTTSGISGGSWSRKERRSTLIQQVLENRDLLALCVAALGHDVGHPGLSNAFMKNARTPLSVVYDDKSTLEQMHCALLLQLMRKHGLGHLIATSSEISNFASMAAPCTSSSSSSEHGHGFKCSDATDFRKTLVQTVLITDMSLHFGWMGKLGELAKDAEKGEALTKNALVDVKMTVCQALIKCGDISNPARPHAVSEHWSSALLEEWSCQAMLERELGLPLSVAASADEVTQAKGQIGFIDLFTKPLFDTTSSVIPSMEVFARQGDINRAQWQQRLDKCVAAAETSAPRVVAPVRYRRLSQGDHFRSVFPLSLPPSLLTPLPTPSPAGAPFGSGWPTASLGTASLSTPPNEEEDESGTPTMPPTSAPPMGHPREGRQHGSVSSASSMAASSPSPFSPGGAVGDSSSTAASSPASHGRSILGSDGGTSFPSASAAPEVQPTPVRAAYNASVRKKKSFHRFSWNPQRKVDIPPAVPGIPPEHLTP